jgi:uncharacterized repeat protein (TIGR01451 family)
MLSNSFGGETVRVSLPRSSMSFLCAFLLALGSSQLVAAQTASLSLTKVDAPDPVPAGTSLVYTLAISNEGPDDAATVELADVVPANTTFQSFATPAGWTCMTPAVGGTGPISCSTATLAPGSAEFLFTVLVGGGVANGTILTNTATVSSATTDPSPDDNSASVETTVSAAVMTAIAIAKTDAPDPVVAGNDISYTITASNNSGESLATGNLSETLPAGTTFVALTVPAGWACGTPAVGGMGAVACAAAPWPSGDAVFTLVLRVDPAVPGGTVIGNMVSLAATSDSGQSTMQAASATTTVVAPTQLTGTKTVSGDSRPGGTVTYAVVLTNTSIHSQADNAGAEFTDTLPAELALVSAVASAGTAAPAGNTVTWNGALAAAASVTITIVATLSNGAQVGAMVSNQGTISFSGGGAGSNDATADTDDPGVAGGADPTVFVVSAPSVVEVPTLGGAGLVLLALLLALAAARRLGASPEPPPVKSRLASPVRPRGSVVSGRTGWGGGRSSS